jgi:hypothetical protein
VSEDFAVLGEGGGIEREEHEELVFAEGIDDWPFGQLQRDGDRFPVEALAQCPGPLIDGLGAMHEHERFATVIAGDLQADVVLGPVQADERGEARELR